MAAGSRARPGSPSGEPALVVRSSPGPSRSPIVFDHPYAYAYAALRGIGAQRAVPRRAPARARNSRRRRRRPSSRVLQLRRPCRGGRRGLGLDERPELFDRGGVAEAARGPVQIPQHGADRKAPPPRRAAARGRRLPRGKPARARGNGPTVSLRLTLAAAVGPLRQATAMSTQRRPGDWVHTAVGCAWSGGRPADWLPLVCGGRERALSPLGGPVSLIHSLTE